MNKLTKVSNEIETDNLAERQPSFDSPALKALWEQAKKLPPMTETQRRDQSLDFAYGNLACSTNHRPRRKDFKIIAMERGMTEAEFEAWADEREWW